MNNAIAVGLKNRSNLGLIGSRAMATNSIIPAERIRKQKPNIWVEINQAVAKYNPVNLGQGFPDMLPVGHVLESIASMGNSDVNYALHQYTRSMGHPRLVNILAKIYNHYIPCSSSVYDTINDKTVRDNTFAPGRTLDPMSEVLVSVGAYGSLYASISAFINPGDEVIIIDPSFDCYAPMITMAGGVLKRISLKPECRYALGAWCVGLGIEPYLVQDAPCGGDSQVETSNSMMSDDWRIDPEELLSKVTVKTKAIIINTPNNPLGKVFDLDELHFIADVCNRHNLLCISDEVYEWLVYSPKKHIKIASLPGMWGRTLTIGSAGKTFSVTGWKTGWTVGPAHLIGPMQLHQQNTIYTCPTPIQEAIARSLEIEYGRLNTSESYFLEMAKTAEFKMASMIEKLTEVGMKTCRPSGGYFLVVDLSAMPVPKEIDQDDSKSYDFRFNQWMMEHKDEKTLEKVYNLLSKF